MRPPAVSEEWANIPGFVQASLIAYENLRQLEDANERSALIQAGQH